MKRLIKISGKQIFLTPGFSLTWAQTNLPVQSFKVRTNRTHLWEVNVKNYEREKGILTFKVVNYQSTDKLFFDQQKLKGKINGIRFLTLEREAFLAICSYYTLKDIVPYLEVSEPLKDQGFKIESSQKLEPFAEQSIFQESAEREIDFEFPFNEALFGHGYLECTAWVPELNESTSVRISNKNLIPEFFLIRNFFHRVFHRKKFTVNALIRFEHGKIVEVHAKSKEIDSINGRILERIRSAPFHHLTHNPQSEKVILVSPEDLLKEYEQITKEKEQVSRTIENEDIFSLWMAHSGVRNRHQLVYLAGKIQMPDSKIRITLKPDFGFLFHHLTEKYHHWIWELLDSNATYVWSFSAEDFSVQRCLQKVEELIQYISDLGRIRYKSWTKQDPGKDYAFHAIHHDGQKSIGVDPFVIWKGKLTELLI